LNELCPYLERYLKRRNDIINNQIQRDRLRPQSGWENLLLIDLRHHISAYAVGRVLQQMADFQLTTLTVQNPLRPCTGTFRKTPRLTLRPYCSATNARRRTTTHRRFSFTVAPRSICHSPSPKSSCVDSGALANQEEGSTKYPKETTSPSKRPI
jgi:hypothetical protein